MRCLRMDGRAIADRILEVVGNRKCYVTLDVDAMDPAYTGGTGHRHPVDVCIAARNPVVFERRQRDWGDVVEVSPPYDEAAKTAIVGAIVAMDMLHILGEARGGSR